VVDGGLLTLNVTSREIDELTLVVMTLWFKDTKPGGRLHIGNEMEATGGDVDIVLGGFFIEIIAVYTLP
jgi:hypothetical protein